MKFDTMTKLPKWTLIYNTVNVENVWIGSAWEFFDEEITATKRYEELSKLNLYPTKRPYYHSQDFSHLGASHQFWYQQSVKEKC